MKPVYVLSSMAPGPGCQPAPCADAAGANASNSKVTTLSSATIRKNAKRIAAPLRSFVTTFKHTWTNCYSASKDAAISGVLCGQLSDARDRSQSTHVMG